MSGHDGGIGQQWADPESKLRELYELIHRVIGEDPHAIYVVLGYLAGSAPVEVRVALLSAEHEQGRHRDGRCPELCPRF